MLHNRLKNKNHGVLAQPWFFYFISKEDAVQDCGSTQQSAIITQKEDSFESSF